MNGQEDECTDGIIGLIEEFLLIWDRSWRKMQCYFFLESGLLQTGNLITKEQQTIKGLHIAADINTLAENSVERFTIDNSDAFVTNAQDVYLGILKQLEDKLSISKT